MSSPESRTAIPATPRGTALRLVLTAAGFLLLYLAVDTVSGALASSPLPLPNAAVAETRDWFAANPAAAVTGAVLQFLSVCCLVAFAVALRATARSDAARAAARRAAPLAFLAAGLMTLSSVLSCVLAGVAGSAPLGAVAVLRTANFVAGGTAHVVALGLFVLLASRLPVYGRFLRVAAIVVAVPAVLSLVSLVVFQGAALILLGRLLSMAWIVCAAITAARRQEART